jgi:hypothetical protein
MENEFYCNMELTKKELTLLLFLLSKAANEDEKIRPLFNKIEKKAFDLLTIDEIENIYKK